MILFLDFDGVLHPENPERDADFTCNRYLWEVLRACPRVEVVFSTTWREFHPVDELVGFATNGGGEDLASRFIGVTPIIADHSGAPGRREQECRLWRTDHAQHTRSWIALDDFEEYFTVGCGNLYLVDHRVGLTAMDAFRLIQRLSKA